jgi:hypothetical protein
VADIFNSREGFVAIFRSERVLPGRVQLEGFNPEAALISGVKYSQSVSKQFQASLDGSIYLYVFGDSMGDVIVQGIAFPQVCSGAGEGLLEVLKFYEENRASKKSTPIKVTIGKAEAISGFLTSTEVTGTGVGGDDPSSFFSSYSLTINALPKR